MRQILLSSLFIFITFSLVVNDASARRFGGGGGFGMMRSNTFAHNTYGQRSFRQAQRPKPAYTSAAQRQTTKNSRWRGALTGLLLGSVLTSLFMGHGLGGGLLSWFLVGLSVYFIVTLLRRHRKRY